MHIITGKYSPMFSRRRVKNLLFRFLIQSHGVVICKIPFGGSRPPLILSWMMLGKLYSSCHADDTSQPSRFIPFSMFFFGFSSGVRLCALFCFIVGDAVVIPY